MRNDRYIFCPQKEDARSEPLANDELPDRLRSEIEQFFLMSVSGTDKQVKFEGWHESLRAFANIKQAMKASSGRIMHEPPDPEMRTRFAIAEKRRRSCAKRVSRKNRFI